MKPVGLIDKRTGIENYAVVQLRQDNSAKTLFNLVGFQTNLKWGAQKELIHSIPGLEYANIIRYGVMHRNTFINSPQILNPTLETKRRKGLFFAGQITGTEGYTESIATGMLAGINMARRIQTSPEFLSSQSSQRNSALSAFRSAPRRGDSEQDLITLPRETMLGALSFYITDIAHLKHVSSRDNSIRYLPLQPTNSNWAIVTPIELPKHERKNKKLKAELLAKRSIEMLEDFVKKY